MVDTRWSPTHAQVGRFNKRDPRTEGHDFTEAGCGRAAVVESWQSKEKCVTAASRRVDERQEVPPKAQPGSDPQQKPVRA